MRSSSGPSKLFVGDIGNNRKSDLSRLFSKYGEISTIYFDENKRFAFIEFTSPSDAERALRHTNHKTVNGSRLRVEYAKPDRPPRDNRHPVSHERSPASALYNHLEVTANRLPSMQAIRQNYYQYHPSTMMSNSAISRGRSLTPPSFKHNPRLSSMNHLRTPDFYPPYYPPHSAVYPDSAYYRTYGDPYLMQRLPPPPTFLPPVSPPPPSSSSSSNAYRNMYPSSGLHRYPQETSHKRTRRSRSRSGRRSPTSRKNRSSRERKRKRQSSSSSSSSSEEQRERGPQTPPSSSNRTRKRSHSSSNANASPSEQKSSSGSSSEDETFEDKESNSKKSRHDDSSRKHSKKQTRR